MKKVNIYIILMPLPVIASETVTDNKIKNKMFTLTLRYITMIIDHN